MPQLLELLASFSGAGSVERLPDQPPDDIFNCFVAFHCAGISVSFIHFPSIHFVCVFDRLNFIQLAMFHCICKLAFLAKLVLTKFQNIDES